MNREIPHFHKCVNHSHEGTRVWKCYSRQCQLPGNLVCGSCENRIILQPKETFK